MKKSCTFVLVVVALMTSALLLASCGSALSNDAKRIQGTWKTEDGAQTLVFTSTEIKSVGQTFGYKLAANGKISISYQDQVETASYAFSKDGKTLTITETVPNTEATSTAQPQTSKLVLKWVSSDTSTEPTVTASTGL